MVGTGVRDWRRGHQVEDHAAYEPVVGVDHVQRTHVEVRAEEEAPVEQTARIVDVGVDEDCIAAAVDVGSGRRGAESDDQTAAREAEARLGGVRELVVADDEVPARVERRLLIADDLSPAECGDAALTEDRSGVRAGD